MSGLISQHPPWPPSIQLGAKIITMDLCPSLKGTGVPKEEQAPPGFRLGSGTVTLLERHLRCAPLWEEGRGP